MAPSMGASMFFLLRPGTVPVARCQVTAIGQSCTSWLSFPSLSIKCQGPRGSRLETAGPKLRQGLSLKIAACGLLPVSLVRKLGGGTRLAEKQRSKFRDPVSS